MKFLDKLRKAIPDNASPKLMLTSNLKKMMKVSHTIKDTHKKNSIAFVNELDRHSLAILFFLLPAKSVYEVHPICVSSANRKDPTTTNHIGNSCTSLCSRSVWMEYANNSTPAIFPKGV